MNDLEHLDHLKRIFSKCRAHGIRINPAKTLIGFDEGPCLGFIVSGEKIRASMDKTKAILEMPAPSNVSEVRTFIGLVNFYRRFLPDLSRVALPLTSLTKKDQRFQWTEKEMTSFQNIKQLIAADISLHHFDPKANTTVTSDASEQGWAASLRQGDNIIAFASGRFSPAQAKYAPHERECLGAMNGMEKFRHYLVGGPVTLLTDSRAIAWLQKSKELSPKLFRWSLRIQEFSPEIQHRQGSSIPMEDCGSRLPVDTFAKSDAPSDLEAAPQVSFISSFPPTVSFITRSMQKAVPLAERQNSSQGVQSSEQVQPSTSSPDSAL